MAKCKKYGCNRTGAGYATPACDNKGCPGAAVAKFASYRPTSKKARVIQQGEVFKVDPVQGAVFETMVTGGYSSDSSSDSFSSGGGGDFGGGGASVDF